MWEIKIGNFSGLNGKAVCDSYRGEQERLLLFWLMAAHKKGQEHQYFFRSWFVSLRTMIKNHLNHKMMFKGK